MTNVYRAAIAGCGRVAGGFDDDPLRTSIWTHAGAYLAHPRTRLVAAADRDPRALAAFGRRWGVESLYSNVSSLLANEAVDILSVCTWSDSHHEIASMAAQAGVKAIWCEKPIAASLAEADGMLHDCQNAVLAVNHVRRWDPAYCRSRELLKQGAIGQLQGAVCTYSGGISNIGTHLFDTLIYLMGPALEVRTHTGAAGCSSDPSPSGDILFQDGSVAHVVGCDPQAYLIFEIDLLGADGRLRLVNNGRRVEWWSATDSPNYSGVRELEFKKLVHQGDEGQRMVEAISDIIDCVEQGGKPRCSGEDGRAALELAAAFIRSYKSGRRVRLPLTGKSLHQKLPVR